ncbi:MAG TPA: rhodanese-like domain-containing protein [Phycisphaerae bacterium]|jgi:rhodanese-related sulfurtransferase|nr:rhodanese-like domain-containing protein [Phycisphaerae bacterium]
MEIQTIPPAQLHAQMQGGAQPEILDVRTPAEYAVAHIAGTTLIPLDKLRPADVAARRNGAAAPLYVVCEKGGRAAKAARQLLDAGIAPVISIQGGTAGWIAAGLPVIRAGGRVISLERQVRIVAGSLVLIGSLLAWLVHPVFIGVPIFVGSGLVFAGATDFCGMGILLGRMPWNRGTHAACPAVPAKA